MNHLKINEVEALVGITKKNIRFYESEGLLTPRRNSENGYRDYGEAEVDALRRIKLMRKLGVPLEEIRKMQSGVHTVGDGMRRHLITLERDRENLEQAIRLCGGLTDCPARLEDLDAQELLARMETLEQEGATFQNKQRSDIRVRYAAPLVIAGSMTALLVGFMALLGWAFFIGSPGTAPWPLVLFAMAVPLLIIAGILAALVQRLRAAGKGELHDAKNY